MRAIRLYYLAQDLLIIRKSGGEHDYASTKHKITAEMDHEDVMMLNYLMVALSGDNSLAISNNCIKTGDRRKGFRSADIDNFRVRFDNMILGEPDEETANK